MSWPPRNEPFGVSVKETTESGRIKSYFAPMSPGTRWFPMHVIAKLPFVAPRQQVLSLLRGRPVRIAHEYEIVNWDSGIETRPVLASVQYALYREGNLKVLAKIAFEENPRYFLLAHYLAPFMKFLDTLSDDTALWGHTDLQAVQTLSSWPANIGFHSHILTVEKWTEDNRLYLDLFWLLPFLNPLRPRLVWALRKEPLRGVEQLLAVTAPPPMRLTWRCSEAYAPAGSEVFSPT